MAENMSGKIMPEKMEKGMIPSLIQMGIPPSISPKGGMNSVAMIQAMTRTEVKTRV